MSTPPTPGTALPHAAPPTGFRLLVQVVVNAAEHLHLLRATLTAQLRAEGMPVGSTLTALTNRLVLVASELATNALRHGQRPTVVRLLRQRDSFLLEVDDLSPWVGPVYAGDRPPGHGGLGLLLARRLSHDLGWHASTRTKTVWAVLA